MTRKKAVGRPKKTEAPKRPGRPKKVEDLQPTSHPKKVGRPPGENPFIGIHIRMSKVDIQTVRKICNKVSPSNPLSPAGLFKHFIREYLAKNRLK